MSIYTQFKTNEDLESSGIFLEYGLLNNDPARPIRFKIARSGGGNKRYVKSLEQKTKPYRRQIQSGTMEDAIASRIMMEVFAESVVLGWENVDDEQGNPLLFSVQNVVKVFIDLPDLYADIRAQANQAVLFRETILEADAKN